MVVEYVSGHAEKPQARLTQRKRVAPPPRDSERLRRHVVGVGVGLDPAPGETPQVIEVRLEEHADV